MAARHHLLTRVLRCWGCSLPQLKTACQCRHSLPGNNRRFVQCRGMPVDVQAVVDFDIYAPFALVWVPFKAIGIFAFQGFASWFPFPVWRCYHRRCLWKFLWDWGRLWHLFVGEYYFPSVRSLLLRLVWPAEKRFLQLSRLPLVKTNRINLLYKLLLIHFFHLISVILSK